MRTRFTPPSCKAFPQMCKFCGMCSHNASSHNKFMEAFPSIACVWEKSWCVGPHKIHHSCLWCTSYTDYALLNAYKPVPRKKSVSHSE